MTLFEHLPDPFLLLPFRRGGSASVDWTVCKTYIANNYSSSYTSSLESALQQMNLLRSAIVQVCVADGEVSPTESFIDGKLIPYCKLVAKAQAHIPLFGGYVDDHLKFFWHDSFDDSEKYESENANLELLSCVYNLAVSWSHVAVTLASDGITEKIKEAFRAFQNAAGYFDMTEKLLCRLPPELAKSDLTTESLGMLRQICLTMAHHCAYLKAEVDMKDNHAMLSKIAREGGKMYESSCAALKENVWYIGSGRGGLAKLFEQVFRTLSCVFNARAHLHTAALHENTGEQGVVLAHFDQALRYLGQVETLQTTELRSWISSIISNVNKASDRAVSVNNSVYFCRVPAEVETPGGLPRPLGKPTACEDFTVFESTRESDPFFGVVPAHIVAIAAEWRTQQRSLVAACSSSSKSCRKKAAELLSQLNVNDIINVVTGETQTRGRVPTTLRNRIQSVKKGADGQELKVMDTLVRMVKRCNNVYVALQETIQEVNNELERESQHYLEGVKTYGEKLWRDAVHPAHETQSCYSIQAALDRHQRDLERLFTQPFTHAKSKLDSNLQYLGRLDWPMEELDALMPFTKEADAHEHNEKILESVELLKKLLSRKQATEDGQNALLQKLEVLLESDSITHNLSAVEEAHYIVIKGRESQKIGDVIAQVNSAVREEEELLRELEELVSRLAILRSSDPIFEDMQKVCNKLEGACTTYTELYKELSTIAAEGATILELFRKLLEGTKSFVMQRKLEVENAKQMLDRQITFKMAEMEERKQNMKALEDSKRRQEELQKQMELLERQMDPRRSERIAEVLRRQREAVSDSSDPAVQAQGGRENCDAPPSYDALMSGAHPPTSAPLPPQQQGNAPYNPFH
uniref:BRO1 domain-containing protein n=1 Tax=Trypanosoma congolense (strain IL3000) TaxID=1068625 RepID=G0UZJ7_TRYCI|nr:conserved hypothetical protein [Trypanosoma congolense IL3000]